MASPLTAGSSHTAFGSSTSKRSSAYAGSSQQQQHTRTPMGSSTTARSLHSPFKHGAAPDQDGNYDDDDDDASSSTVPFSTMLRHPLASKRFMMVFRQSGEEIREMFELLSRYEGVAPIGQGTYGVVCSARDSVLVEQFQADPPSDPEGSEALTAEERAELYDTATLVAIKKIRQLYEYNQPRLWLCATREIQLMMAFNHDNVMSATDFFIPLGGAENMNYESIRHMRETFDSVYIVMKKMDYTLREVLDSSFITPEEVAPEYYRAIPNRTEEEAKQPPPQQNDVTSASESYKESTIHTREHSALDEAIRMTSGYSDMGHLSPHNNSNNNGACCTDASAEFIDNSLAKSQSLTSGCGTRHSQCTNADTGESASPTRVPEACSGNHNESEFTQQLGSPTYVRSPHTQQPLHPLSSDYRKFILYQIFRGVGYLHKCPVIHRDLKPENIMLDRSYNTCITDFGQGRDVTVAGESQQTVLDNCTQWYAAPETLTLVMNTSKGFIDHEGFHGVDVWSVGCIAAEMLMGRPLFYTPAMGGIGQLVAVMEVIGEPTAEARQSVSDYRDEHSRESFLAVLERVSTLLRGRTRNTLREFLRSPYGDETEAEIELIASCLAWDPKKRITIQAALDSPYFTDDGYEPVIDPEDTAKRVSSVRQEEISEPVSGRAFLWDLFVRRHPEVGQLWGALSRKHQEGK